MSVKLTAKQTDRNEQLVKSLISRYEFLKTKRDETTSLREEIFRLVCPYRSKEGLEDKRWIRQQLMHVTNWLRYCRI